MWLTLGADTVAATADAHPVAAAYVTLPLSDQVKVASGFFGLSLIAVKQHPAASRYFPRFL